MENAMNERFIKAMEYLINSRLVYNQADFANILGVGRSLISDFKNNSKPVTERYVLKISDHFDIFNTTWLLTGEGEMLKDCQNYNNNGVLINGSNTNSPINNKHYYSDALQTQNEQLLERVKEKDAQIKEKDAQIKSLLAIIEKQTAKGI